MSNDIIPDIAVKPGIVETSGISKKEKSDLKESNDFKYHRFGRSNREQQYTEQQFKERDVAIPVKSIVIALIMFLVGTAMIVVGSLLLSGVIDTKYSDRTWPMLIIGTILFIPGFYHVRLAYYAWYEYDGFSFEDIANDD